MVSPAAVPLVVLVVLIMAAYLAGSVPTGVLLARRRGIDLRKVGSGNIGATNVGRALGKKWAAVVLLLDALKGFVPVLAARALGLSATKIAAVALAAVVGHMFSLFLRGRGGKGVATSLGVCLALAPEAALASAGVYAALFALFRISSLGSLAAVVLFPALLWFIGPREPAFVGLALVIAALVVARHKDNIRRLVRGEEAQHKRLS